MIRVLHIIDHLGLGGAQTAVLDMLKNRDRAAFAVEVAVLHGWGQFADALEADGVKVHALSPSKWPPAYLPNFLRLLARERYDVLHFHLQASNWLMKPLAAAAGAPVRIAHDHTSGDLAFRGVGSLAPDGFTHLFSSRVIAVSEGVKDFLTRWEAVSEGAVVVIPNGVDDTGFRPATVAEKASARAALGVPVEAFVVGGMGRLAPEKHFSLVPELAVRVPEAVFVVAGAGPEEAMLRQRVDARRVGDRVRFLGSVADRPAFYRALDTFLLPSLHEGLPMALLEAMAAGLPVLASRLEGIAAALVDEVEGLLATAGVEDEFAAKLSWLIDHPAERAGLGRAAHRKAAYFSAARTARAVERVLWRARYCAPGRA